MELLIIAFLTVVCLLLAGIIVLVKHQDTMRKEHAEAVVKMHQTHMLAQHEMQSKYFDALAGMLRAKNEAIRAKRWANAWKMSAKAYRSASNTEWRKA